MSSYYLHLDKEVFYLCFNSGYGYSGEVFDYSAILCDMIKLGLGDRKKPVDNSVFIASSSISTEIGKSSSTQSFIVELNIPNPVHINSSVIKTIESNPNIGFAYLDDLFVNCEEDLVCFSVLQKEWISNVWMSKGSIMEPVSIKGLNYKLSILSKIKEGINALDKKYSVYTKLTDEEYSIILPKLTSVDRLGVERSLENPRDLAERDVLNSINSRIALNLRLNSNTSGVNLNLLEKFFTLEKAIGKYYNELASCDLNNYSRSKGRLYSLYSMINNNGIMNNFYLNEYNKVFKYMLELYNLVKLNYTEIVGGKYE